MGLKMSFAVAEQIKGTLLLAAVLAIAAAAAAVVWLDTNRQTNKQTDSDLRRLLHLTLGHMILIVCSSTCRQTFDLFFRLPLLPPWHRRHHLRKKSAHSLHRRFRCSHALLFHAAVTFHGRNTTQIYIVWKNRLLNVKYIPMFSSHPTLKSLPVSFWSLACFMSQPACLSLVCFPALSEWSSPSSMSPSSFSWFLSLLLKAERRAGPELNAYIKTWTKKSKTVS